MLIFADLYVCAGSLRFSVLRLVVSVVSKKTTKGPKSINLLTNWMIICLIEQNRSSCPPVRWNVVGFQGSLMSYFTEPIYFSSIILGSLYHADHLSRAMYQRITEIEDLPQSFSLNRPLLSGKKQTALSQTTDFH